MVKKSIINCYDTEIMRTKLESLFIKEGRTKEVIELSQKLDIKIVEIQKRKLERFNMKTGS